MMDTIAMPYNYEDLTLDVQGYKAEKKLKKLFTEVYDVESQKGIKTSNLLRGSKIYQIYRENVEEYYGEILEGIESADTNVLVDILESDQPIAKMYQQLELPIIDFRTGRKLTFN